MNYMFKRKNPHAIEREREVAAREAMRMEMMGGIEERLAQMVDDDALDGYIDELNNRGADISNDSFGKNYTRIVETPRGTVEVRFSFSPQWTEGSPHFGIAAKRTTVTPERRSGQAEVDADAPNVEMSPEAEAMSQEVLDLLGETEDALGAAETMEDFNTAKDSIERDPEQVGWDGSSLKNEAWRELKAPDGNTYRMIVTWPNDPPAGSKPAIEIVMMMP